MWGRSVLPLPRFYRYIVTKERHNRVFQMVYVVWFIALVLITVGFLGTVVPVLPGTPFIFAGALLLGWWSDYEVVGGVTLGILGFLGICGIAVDFVASALGAKRVGASRLALIGATAGSLIGLVGGLIGVVVGPFIGAFIGEMVASASLHAATKVGFGTWIGLIIGTVIKVGVAFSMLSVILGALVF